MRKNLRLVMLIDDNFADNYFHSGEIKKVNPDLIVIEKSMAHDALKYLEWNKNSNFLPELIFLDINMPCMNGWEFLEKFLKFDSNLRDRIIIILSTSDHPDDKVNFEYYKQQSCVSEFITKPLTKVVMKGIIEKYFI